MSIDTLLDRLDKVRRNGTDQWMACCPAHEDRSPSLSIKACDDGRVLVHCFGGCAATDVLAAVGLRMTDLFPEPLGHHFRPTRSRIPASDALMTLDHEVLAIGLIAGQFMETRTLNEVGWHRLATAVSRIGKARLHAQGC